MSRIFRRPMFRKGGGANMNGIMSGIEDRQNYSEAGRVEELTKKNLDMLMQNAPQDKSFDPLTSFLLQYGPALASQTPTGSGLSGLISTGLAAADKPVKSLLEQQAEKRKYLRDLRSGATQLAIEQAGKESLLEQEIKGRKDIAGINATGKMDPIVADVLGSNLKIYGNDNIAVAQAATDFQTGGESARLYNKIGAKAAGVLQFDINNPAIVQSQMKEIKKLDGFVVYDPYQKNYKYIKYNKGKPEIVPFNSVEEINLDKLNIKTGGDTTKTEPPAGLFGQKTKPDVITPRVKEYIEDVEVGEGAFGSGA